ncbi:hypothetical protein [Mesorhizobium sp. M4B.F.Ca.ET.049.02.1.2]|uniref:hypothetical protein n=1 Tax=Mesorhizobium sp. M4B.F.Ca.ET.049.02.1.2 TaxID=2496752 RepID=UPI000FCB1CCA|nr:hypothetical protein [Mesorhizobium sp. M4B.F.Ca.ET.049.02.1.2]RUW76600.1 hypothetical protein EOA31_06410 [Mesorhizobium sp. M4B.F.Ca.ET.049.02.1.2]
MNTKPLQNSPDLGHEPEAGKQPPVSYRLAWACLPVMLALSGAVLLLFGVSWWTALIVVLLLACPAAIALATYAGFQPRPGASGRRRDSSKQGK